MKKLLAIIGGVEMYIPVNERLGRLMLQAHRRLNYQKHIAIKRKAYRGRIVVNCVEMTTEFFYALEDVLEESGYHHAFHRHFEKFDIEERKILYEIFRNGRTIRFLASVENYSEEKIRRIIINYFESFKKVIL